MKKILLASFLFLSLPAFSCVNTIPQSEAEREIKKIPASTTLSCGDLPDEPCLCFDGIILEAAELVDNEVVDYVAWKQFESCKDELDCEEKFSRLSCKEGAEKKNLENMSVYCAVNIMKKEGKKLVNSPEKKAAFEAVVKAREAAFIAKQEQRKSAIERFKAFEPKGTSAATLRAELKSFSEDIKKILEL